MLHFAPEPALRKRLSTMPSLRYATADIAPGRASASVNLEDLAFQSGVFDFVLCCHVLEHVREDGKALRELHRVLRKGGMAIVQVPLRKGVTDEDPAVADPDARRRRFGQEDHVRWYGMDFADRMSAAGFRVETVETRNQLNAEESERCGLFADGGGEDVIFLGHKDTDGD
jgi:SAM-dependent methyltransferase